MFSLVLVPRLHILNRYSRRQCWQHAFISELLHRVRQRDNCQAAAGLNLLTTTTPGIIQNSSNSGGGWEQWKKARLQSSNNSESQTKERGGGGWSCRSEHTNEEERGGGDDDGHHSQASTYAQDSDVEDGGEDLLDPAAHGDVQSFPNQKVN